MKLTTEYSIRLYDDDSGDYLALSPNIDGAGLFEVRSVAQGQTEGCLVLTSEQVDALIEGLKRLKELNSPKVLMQWMGVGAVPLAPGKPEYQPGASPIPLPHQNK